MLAEGSAGRAFTIKALGSGKSVENCIGIGAGYTGKGGWVGSRTEGRFCISVVLRCEGAAVLRCCDAPNLGEAGLQEAGGACRAGPSDAQMKQCDLSIDCTVTAAVLAGPNRRGPC